MADSYIALVEPGIGEIIEKKSRFIGYTASVATEEEANEFVNSIRKKHYDARHNCFAYSIGTDMPKLRFSDDGEPQGTAGKPILDVIMNSGISNICIVVTRYFGGTLLGTGGLVRAYADASRAAIEHSVTKKMQHLFRCRIETNYSDMGKIQYILSSGEIPTEDIQYADQVVITAALPVERKEQLKKAITEATSARAVITEIEELFG
jgi:uncharacterized YigZ family protein